MGHMNVMWYTGKFDEASWVFLSHLGLTRSVLRGRNRMMAAVQQNITYKRELLAGDIITIRSGILELKEKSGHDAPTMNEQLVAARKSLDKFEKAWAQTL